MCFFIIFLLTFFENTLKYTHVSQQANINRQQAKMTFQFACRKPPSDKDLEPASPNPCMPLAGNRFEHLNLCNLDLFRI
jgi:hypothetical protein